MLLEIVAQSVDDALAAEAAGADRLELVSALSLGGLTPSLGTLEETIARCKLPVVAMLRPRSGGFAYSEGEIAAMERDGRRFLAAGARGLAFGILDGNGRPAEANRRLVALGDESVFHRAFDVPEDALESVVELGFRRILTSGGSGNALEGVERIRSLVDRAAGRIEILPGGGIRAENAAEIVARAGVAQVHLSAQEWAVDGSAPSGSFNGPRHPEDRFGRVDGRIVAAVRAAL